MAILIAIATLILQKNFGDTDYPSMIFSEHTYGALSLAIVTLIFGLLFLQNMFFGGLFIALLISIHPLIGVWINGVIFLTILINKYYFKFSFNYSSFFKGFLIGIFLTIISFLYHYISSPEFNSYLNLLTYENYMKYWEGHRTFSGYHIEYLIKTFVLFVCCSFSLILLQSYLPDNSKFGFLCIAVSILTSSIIYFIYKIFYLYIPDSIKLIIPSRFIIMHSVIGWPLILAIFFIFLKKLERNYNLFKNTAYIFIFSIILIYSTLHYKTFNKIKNSFIVNSEKKITNNDDDFWNIVRNEKFDGYIVTSYSSSLITFRKGLKPIMLDVTSFDFVPYFPNTAESLRMIIENIYGIEFSNPPAEIRNSALLTDKVIKLTFEERSKENWDKLSYDFNLGAILVPVNWKVNLKPHAKNKKFGNDSPRI